MKQFLINRWFLITMLSLLLIGIFNGPLLRPLASNVTLRYAIVASVLFLMALPLKASVVWETLRRPWAPLLASVLNLGLLPLFAWLLGQALTPSLAAGLAVAAATPCTLASAAVWTRRAGGNDAAAMMTTIITNSICFLVTPLWLITTTGKDVEIDAWAMVARLAFLVVLPMAFAQLLRLSSFVAEVASRRRTQFGVLAQIGVLSMIFMGAIRTGQSLFGSQARPFQLLDVGLMIAVVMTVHLTILAAGMLLAGLFGFARKDRIAVGMAGSQKTLMVGLQVAMDCEITILPMITYHVGQLLVDTLIADWLRKKGEDDDETTAVGAEVRPQPASAEPDQPAASDKSGSVR